MATGVPWRPSRASKKRPDTSGIPSAWKYFALTEASDTVSLVAGPSSARSPDSSALNCAIGGAGHGRVPDAGQFLDSGNHSIEKLHLPLGAIDLKRPQHRGSHQDISGFGTRI